MYNFDTIINRHGTNAIKTDSCKNLFGTEDILPLWVADMDFATPDFILEAIRERLEHPILGYSNFTEDFNRATIQWIYKRHSWTINPEWIGFVSGIVSGIAFAVQALTELNDEIIIQPPVYHPFIHVVEKNHRKLVYNPLKTVNGKFEPDFDDLEQKITPNTKMLILCNPHNPGGRIWNKETLIRLADICAKNNIIVISDEIHADMALKGYTHTPFATVSPQAEAVSLTFMAPSKTFNIPGLVSSSYIIPNPELRKRYVTFLEQLELTHGTLLTYTATLAAYEKGEKWREQMLNYVQKNIDFVSDFLQKNIPQIKPMLPEASFLIWLDCTSLNFENTDDLFRFFVDKAGLGLNIGTMFGPGGEQHLRINVACPRAIIEQAMNQLKKGLSQKSKKERE